MNKSKYHIVPRKDLEQYGNMIMLKKISYKQLLKHLSEEFKELEGMSSESLRRFMVLKKFVLNEKSFTKINQQIQKQSLSLRKRKITVANIKSDILKDRELQNILLSDTKFINELFSKNIVKKKILELIIEITKGK